MPGIFVMKAGDTLPSLEAILLDTAGNPVNLGNTAVRLHIALRATRAIILNVPVIIVGNPIGGHVKFDWTTLAVEDLLSADIYLGEWEVTFSDDTIETFPNDGYFLVKVFADLA